MGNKQGATFNDETIAEFSKISGKRGKEKVVFYSSIGQFYFLNSCILWCFSTTKNSMQVESF